MNNLLDMIMWLIISEHINYWNPFDKFDFSNKQKKKQTKTLSSFIDPLFWTPPTFFMHYNCVCWYTLNTQIPW